MNYIGLFIVLFTITGIAFASPTTYNIDPNHTHPMFEADHFGRLIRLAGAV